MQAITDAKVTRVYKENLEALDFPYVVNVGGARSTKSHSLCQLFIGFLFWNYKFTMGITRKTMPALKMTAYKVFIELMMEYNLYNAYHHNKTLNFYENPFNKSRIQFFSIDDPGRMKSTEFNFIWLEEANEFTYADFMLLDTRMSARNDSPRINQMFMSLNPDDDTGWIAKRMVTDKDSKVIHSTYKDNPFLPKDYVVKLEKLKKKNPEYWKIYGKGLWGSNASKIYTNYVFIEEMPENPDVTIYGLDFGYNNPSVLVKVMLKDKEVYVTEKFYGSEMLNDDIINKLKLAGVSKSDEIYADSASKDRIQEIYDAGYNIKPAEKDVMKGIDTVKKYQLNIEKDAEHIINEITKYKWKVNKNGENLDEPVKEDDHAMDALRYALHSYMKEYGGEDTDIFGAMRL